MTEATRYNYEKRIKDLQQRVDDLECYRSLALNIYAGAIDVINTKSNLNPGWVVERFRGVMK